MNQKEKQKNDKLLAIVFCLLLLTTAATNYNKTGQIEYFFAEIICLILLLISIIRYIKARNEINKSKRKPNKKKQNAYYNNQFIKKAEIVNKKYNHKEPPPELTSGHIQSMWDELKKY